MGFPQSIGEAWNGGCYFPSTTEAAIEREGVTAARVQCTGARRPERVARRLVSVAAQAERCRRAVGGPLESGCAEGPAHLRIFRALQFPFFWVDLT